MGGGGGEGVSAPNGARVKTKKQSFEVRIRFLLRSTVTSVTLYPRKKYDWHSLRHTSKVICMHLSTQQLPLARGPGQTIKGKGVPPGYARSDYVTECFNPL